MLIARTFIDRLLASGIATPLTIIGCNEQEIRAIEKRLQVKLPESYKEFLRVAGKCAGYLNLTDYYPELMELKEKATHLLARSEGSNLELPEKAFVYSMST